METRPIGGMTLYYDAAERPAAELIGGACEESARIIEGHWGLRPPPDTRVYVLTSWPRFVLHSAPAYWWPLLAITLPWWVYRTATRWQMARGWEQDYWTRQAVGVKPPRLVEPLIAASRRAGSYFVAEEGPEELIRSTTGHELTHACTAHLRLPMWLNEGLAMRTVDRLLGREMVKPETLELLARGARGRGPVGYARINARDREAVLYHYVRAYWVTRHLEETRPELLRSLLARRRGRRRLEARVAAAYGQRPGELWGALDEAVLARYQRRSGGDQGDRSGQIG